MKNKERKMKTALLVQGICVMTMFIIAAMSEEPRMWQIIAAWILLIPYLISELVYKKAEDDLYETERSSKKDDWFYEYCSETRKQRAV